MQDITQTDKPFLWTKYNFKYLIIRCMKSHGVTFSFKTPSHASLKFFIEFWHLLKITDEFV